MSSSGNSRSTSLVLRRSSRAGLHETVVRALAEALVRGDLKPGQALPPIPELAHTLRASSTTVREAVRTLEAARLLGIRAGSGVYVTPRDEWVLLNSTVLDAFHATGLLVKIIDEILEARRYLETLAVRLAAERITCAGVECLERDLVEMGACIDDEQSFLGATRHFHHDLMRSAGNSLLRSMTEPLTRFMTVIAATVYQAHPTPLADRQAGLERHQQMLEAIRTGKAADAEAVMLRHLAVAEVAVRRHVGPATP